MSFEDLKPIKKVVKTETHWPINTIEVRGNKDANYVKFGNYGDSSNLIYLEVGDCCAISFRGIVTAEMFSAFLTKSSWVDNKGLIENMKKMMDWGEEANEEFCKGASDLDFTGAKFSVK